jgi:hypothetical protein
VKVLLSFVAIASVSLAGCYPEPAVSTAPEVYTGSHNGHPVEVIESRQHGTVVMKNDDPTSWVDGYGAVREGVWKPESLNFHGAPFCEPEDFVTVRIERQLVTDIDWGPSCKGEMSFDLIWETAKSLEDARLILRNDIGSVP